MSKTMNNDKQLILVNQGFSDIKNLTKKDILSKVQEVNELISNGELDVYEALAIAKRFETVGKSLVDICRSFDISKNSKYGIDITETSKYDYSTCNDSVLNDLLTQEAEIKDKISERKKFLTAIPKGGVADPETGEMIYPASKGKPIINISLK